MWLVVNGRGEEAEQTLQKMARYNGVKVHGRLLSSATEEKLLHGNSGDANMMNGRDVTEGKLQDVDVPPDYPWYYLFKDSNLLVFTIVSSTLW